MFHQIATPVRIASAELLKSGDLHFVRVRSSDGAEGISVTNQLPPLAHPIFAQRIVPTVLGTDARGWATTADRIYRADYKIAGLLFWSAMAWMEFAILDLLGKTAGRSVAELLGKPLRSRVQVYLSRMNRETTPEQELAILQERLTETGCKAVKVKIGGRMSGNADASPGRSERLVALLRKHLPADVLIYVDANGSYDAPRAIEVGRMLQDHGVALYEEPCPFEDIHATAEVAAALDIPVAGGEQDSSLTRFGEILRFKAVDILQPDVYYCGGLLRALQIATMAQSHGVPIIPHSPKNDAVAGPLLQLLAILPNLGPYHEWHAARPKPPWYTPPLIVHNGAVDIPQGPGLGLDPDPDIISRAVAII